MRKDTIYRQDAIDAMCEACSDWCDEGVCKKVSAIQKLPSAQPEPCDDPRADIYYLAEKIGIHRLYALVVELRGEPEPCKDAVSRQAAIEAIDDANDSLVEDDYTYGVQSGMEKAKYVIEALPSAEPEIIRCKDCKYSSDDEYCHCSKVTWWNGENDFCSRAERRTGA